MAATASSFFPELNPAVDGIDVDTAGNDSAATKAIKSWCEAAYEEASEDQRTSEELKMVDKYIEYLQNQQWPASRPSYRSKPVNNRMNRLFWELVSLLTDIRPVIDIHANERSKQCLETESVLTDTTRAWWLNNDIDQKVAMCTVYAILTTSFAKLEWDPSADMNQGELRLIPLGPSSLLPLKPQTDLQSSDACIYSDIKGTGWVRWKYPKRAHVVRPDIGLSQYSVESGSPKNVTPQLFAMLTPAYKRLLSKGQYRTGVSAYPMCRYREFWIKDYTVNTSGNTITMGDPSSPWKTAYLVKPNEMFYPRGRLIVMAGNEVVHDGPNPYWHGQFPFAMLRLNVVPWQLYGMSDLRSWMDLQDIVNQIYAGVIDMIKRAVNPPFFAPKTALTEATWQSVDLSMPGARIAYNAVSPTEPKVVSVAPLPGFVLQMLTNVEREMDQQSGIAAVNEAVRKKQVPGGDTLDQIRQNQQTPIRQKARNIEIFLRDLGSQVVPNQMQFYTQKKRIYMLGNMGGTKMDFEWDPEKIIPSGTEPMEYVRKFKFSTLEGTLLSVQRTDMVMNLYRLRLTREIDRHTFFERLKRIGVVDLDADLVEKNLKKEMAEGLSGAPPKKGGGGAKPQ